MRCIALFVFYCAVRFHGMCELDRECEDTLNDMSVSVRGSLYFIEMTKTSSLHSLTPVCKLLFSVVMSDFVCLFAGVCTISQHR